MNEDLLNNPFEVPSIQIPGLRSCTVWNIHILIWFAVWNTLYQIHRSNSLQVKLARLAVYFIALYRFSHSQIQIVGYNTEILNTAEIFTYWISAFCVLNFIPTNKLQCPNCSVFAHPMNSFPGSLPQSLKW